MTAPSFAASAMTEAQLQDSVIALAQLYGWHVFHDQDSRRNPPGLPIKTLNEWKEQTS